MITPMIGEIRMLAFSRVPQGWLPCDGGIHRIEHYDELFMLLGATYGGDGAETFAVPDLRGQLPVHQGLGSSLGAKRRVVGDSGGQEAVALDVSHLPAHSHPYLVSTSDATSTKPKGLLLAAVSNGDGMYITPEQAASGAVQPMLAGVIPALSTAAVGALHDNQMPTLTASYCIAARGFMPSRAD
jgi:microcystin-dependent protein